MVGVASQRVGIEPTTEVVRLSLLGPLEVTRAGDPLALSGPKRRALLILLALQPGVAVPRDRIVDVLWPDRTTGREIQTLRVHISHLRDVLEPRRRSTPRLLVTEGSGYLLDPAGVEVDLDRFVRLAGEGRDLVSVDAEAAVARLSEALGLWRGRPLQDVEYEEFAQESIRRMLAVRIEAIEDRAAALSVLGEDAAAVEDLESLVRSDPSRERPVLLLMRALYRSGRHAESLRVARRHVRTLGELGLDPSPRITELERRILQHDRSLLPDAPSGPGTFKVGRSVRGMELREEIGAGRLGVLFRAFQSTMGREVAVKLVHADLTDPSGFVLGFAAEARSIANLEHPHIVPVYDFWRDPLGAALVMRWMEGGDLASRIGGGWESPAVVRAFSQIAGALAYAHGTGTIHGNIHGRNVLFDAADHAYLSDFGFARVTHQAPRASTPDLGAARGPVDEVPTVATDVYALGLLLAETVTGCRGTAAIEQVEGRLREVVGAATATDPRERFPDVLAFRDALPSTGSREGPAPRRLQRNPYKGLAPFTEADHADLHGRDDVVETLLGAVGHYALTAVIGASGSGKSSVVRAGLVPALRRGALPGSEAWAIVTMSPGTDPFDGFHLALREVAVTFSGVPPPGQRGELLSTFTTALGAPDRQALLVIDQFEEIFSSQIDARTRARFLDELVELSEESHQRIRLVITLRADLSQRALTFPRFGELVARSAVLLAPMRSDQVEEAIVGPATRAGLQIEPALIAEIVRDVASASAYLPLLQYVLTELFERRTDDRLTVDSYRALGGVHGVLERRAEATFNSLPAGARDACRQLFLRMVHLGDHGEETRRRLPLAELPGLGGRADLDLALRAFVDARLVTLDHDPATRTPTVEVAHETVIHRWARYQVWIDEVRSDLLAHRRLTAAAQTWTDADEDPGYLLARGPLASAIEVASKGSVALNDLEARYVETSRRRDEEVRAHEAARRREEERLRQRARRRLRGGVVAAGVAVLVAVFAAVAVVERQRADDLAEVQQRHSVARELAAASIGNLGAGDPELSLLLAIEAAGLSEGAGEEILPEVVDALHLSVISPRPTLDVTGAGSARGARLLAFSPEGDVLALLSDDGGVVIIDAEDGSELQRLPAQDPPAFGVDFHPLGHRILTLHADRVREWGWRTGDIQGESAHPDDVDVTTAAYAPRGERIATGGTDGAIRVWDDGELVAELRENGHVADVAALDFDPTGERLVAAGAGSTLPGDRSWTVLVWDIASEQVVTRARTDMMVLPVVDVAWHPVHGVAAVTTRQGDVFLFDTSTGERLNTFGAGGTYSVALSFDVTGSFLVAAGGDGVARVYGTWVGGEAGIVLPTGGVPLGDVAFDPSSSADPVVATVGVDGRVRIWRDLTRSELPARFTSGIYPQIAATPSGHRYLVSPTFARLFVAEEPAMEVIDAATSEALVRRRSVAWGGERRPALSQDGSVAAFAGASGEIELTDVETGATRAILASAPWTACLDLSPDGSLVAGGGIDGSISIYDVASGQLLQRLHGHGDREPVNRSAPTDPPQGADPSLHQLFAGTIHRVDEVRFHPDGRSLLSAGFDGTVRRWDVSTGEGRVLHTFDHEVFSLALSPDGSWLAAADRTGEVVLLDASTGDVEMTLEPISGKTELVFSPDGRHLAGAGPGPVANLWELERGRIVRRFHGAVYQPQSAAFVNGGTELRVVGGEGVDRGYVLDPARLAALARDQATRVLTEEECRRYLRGVDTCSRG